MRFCTYCGYKNSDESKFCLRCGSNLSLQLPPWTCPSCGAPNIPRSTFCESCGKRIVPEAPGEAKPAGVKPPSEPTPLAGTGDGEFEYPARNITTSGKPFWAGILLVLGGIVDIGNGIAAFFRTIPANDIGIDLSGYVACCGALVIIFGFGAVIGGIFSISRRHFYFVLIGAILGMLGVGYFFVGTILCFIALILVAVSKDDYPD